MILRAVNKDGKSYECYAKSNQELRKMQDKIREERNALCPACLEHVQIRIYVDGTRTNHFFHLGDGCGFGKGESEEHLLSKIAIRKYLERRDLWSDCTFEFEHRVTLESGEVRVIDLAVFHPDGRKEAHEAQLSNQSASVIDERSEAYSLLGFTPIWWLGDKNKFSYDHCLQTYGWAASIEIERTAFDFGTEKYSTVEG